MNVIDYFLVNYLQPEAGHAQAEIRTKGERNFLFDFACAKDGLYYLGICQKTLAQNGYSSLNQSEVLETGDTYKRANFFVSRYCCDTYLGGDGSKNKITWNKIYLKAGERHLLFINFDDDPGEFLIWG